MNVYNYKGFLSINCNYVLWCSIKKIPGCFILINNKNTQVYLTAFKAFKRLLTLENTLQIKIISITTDFEDVMYYPNIIQFPAIY